MSVHPCRCWKSLISAVLALASPLAAGEADWQASAKGLTEGPLCSLVLRVNIGKTLDLVAPGGSCDTGWNTLGPADIPLGSIGLPSTLTVTDVARTGDWSHSKAVVTLEGGAKLTLYASMLSPGIVIETSTDKLRLFGGQHERMVTFDKGKMKIHGHMGGNLAPKTPVTPAHIRLITEGWFKPFDTSGPIPAPDATDPGALLWWGKASHFLRTSCPVPGIGFHSDACQGDGLLGLTFSRPPVSIAAAKEGGLDFAFAERGCRVEVVTSEWDYHARAETDDPSPKDPRHMPVTRIPRSLIEFEDYPLSARESFRYDAAKDEALFTEKVAFLELARPAHRRSPLPPLAALVMHGSLPIACPAELEGTAGLSEFGFLTGAWDADTVSWSVGGLGKYVPPPAAKDMRGKAPTALETELAAEAKKMLAAGRLAPWVYADNIPISASRGELYWGEPGEVLYLMAQVYPALPKEQQAAWLEAMADIRKAYPPETRPLLPADKGARRGGYDVGPCEVSKTIARERGTRVSLFALYGLERYYALSGQKPTPEEWKDCKAVITGAFEEQGWATLYHLGHPDRFLPWEGANAAEREKLRKEHGASPSWRGDRPAAVVNVNRQFSGAIGAIRLARLVGDKETEQQAWWLFARTAVLRYALGRYAVLRYGSLAAEPTKADWFWTWRGRGPQNWCGDLETMDWSKPEHDVQQVIEFAPDHVQLGHWAGVMGEKWTQWCTVEPVAFRYLTPELAAFLADHLKAECAAYAERIAWNQPTWYASFAEAILGYEHNMNHPSDAYEHFMARSWILGESAAQLEKWIDVPWLDRGDLFYLNKLAETIRAHRGTQGQRPGR